MFSNILICSVNSIISDDKALFEEFNSFTCWPNFETFPMLSMKKNKKKREIHTWNKNKKIISYFYDRNTQKFAELQKKVRKIEKYLRLTSSISNKIVKK